MGQSPSEKATGCVQTAEAGQQAKDPEITQRKDYTKKTQEMQSHPTQGIRGVRKLDYYDKFATAGHSSGK